MVMIFLLAAIVIKNKCWSMGHAGFRNWFVPPFHDDP
jgi:hypothetical protein